MLTSRPRLSLVTHALLIGVIAVCLIAPVARAQQASVQSSGGPPSSPPESGPVNMQWECWGVGISPYWDDYIVLTVTPAVNGQAGGSSAFVGNGIVDGVVPFSFSLGQSSVTVSCDVSYYSSWTGSASDTFSTSVGGRTPWALSNDESAETFVYNGPGNYLRTRQYVVGDQYGMTWGFVGAVDEWYVEGLDKCNITMITGTAATNEVGRFQDKYGNHNNGPNPIPACEIPQYSSCRTESTQYIQVQGVTFDHAVTWRCNDVQVAR